MQKFNKEMERKCNRELDEKWKIEKDIETYKIELQECINQIKSVEQDKTLTVLE